MSVFWERFHWGVCWPLAKLLNLFNIIKCFKSGPKVKRDVFFITTAASPQNLVRLSVFFFRWDEIHPWCRAGRQLRTSGKGNMRHRKWWMNFSARMLHTLSHSSCVRSTRSARFPKITDLGHMRSDPDFSPSHMCKSIIWVLANDQISACDFVPDHMKHGSDHKTIKSNSLTVAEKHKNTNHAHKYTSQRLDFLLNLKNSFTEEGLGAFYELILTWAG